MNTLTLDYNEYKATNKFSLISLSNRFTNVKKRKGSLLLDIVIGIVLMMIIYYVATVAYPEYRNNANRAQAKEDLSTIKTAVITYQGLSKTPGSSITMDDLTTGLPADEAIDGVQHAPLLTENKLDPWGGEYDIQINADGSGTIRTTGAKAAGLDDLEINIGDNQ